MHVSVIKSIKLNVSIFSTPEGLRYSIFFGCLVQTEEAQHIQIFGTHVISDSIQSAITQGKFIAYGMCDVLVPEVDIFDSSGQIISHVKTVSI